ncbi:MAG: hypothetical protein KGI47_01665 [Betaproteobacteria bacterium]|nr:hypothetical protein [Betaproteobacteria bacterium]MDE2622877.1 hypothetical protein [Betaproteobacteria bacterium]
MLRSFLILAASVALQGCSWYVYDATNRPIASQIAGQCFALRQNAILSEHFSYYTVYTLNLPGANECTPFDVTPKTKDEMRYKASGLRYPKCIWVPVAKVSKGTKFRVTSVTEQPRGGQWMRGGVVRCWEVKITFIDGEKAGITSGIPACHFNFPESELWLQMKSGNEYVEPLQISDRVATPCQK